MLKKMMLMALSVGALIAFAAPAAQANVSLSDTDGQLGAGAEVTATSTNLKTVQTGENGVTLTCAQVVLHFEVVTNGPNHVDLAETEKATTAGCLANGVLPVTIENGGVTANLTFNTWGTANASATFVSKVYLNEGHTVPAAAPCDYAGTLHVTGTASGSDVIKVNKSELKASGCKDAHMEGTFTLETPENGDPVKLNYVSTG